MCRKWLIVSLVVLGLAYSGTSFAASYKNGDQRAVSLLGPKTSDPWNLFLSADFIYWGMNQEGLSYASSVETSSKGYIYEPGWSWEPGFKLGGGINLPYDNWDIQVQYTWIDADSHDDCHAETTSTLQPLWKLTTSGVEIHRAQAQWGMRYQQASLELGNYCYTGAHVNVRLHTGLDYASIRQDYGVRYIQKDGAEERLNMERKFSGIGLSAGIDTSWECIQHLNLFSELSFASIWGCQHQVRKETQLQHKVVIPLLPREYQLHRLEPLLTLCLGVRWESGLDNDRFHFSMQAGWEHRQWLSHGVSMPIPGEVSHTGALIMQGLVLKGRFDF